MVLMNNLMSILLFVLIGTLILGIVFSLFLLFYSITKKIKKYLLFIWDGEILCVKLVN